MFCYAFVSQIFSFVWSRENMGHKKGVKMGRCGKPINYDMCCVFYVLCFLFTWRSKSFWSVEDHEKHNGCECVSVCKNLFFFRRKTNAIFDDETEVVPKRKVNARGSKCVIDAIRLSICVPVHQRQISCCSAQCTSWMAQRDYHISKNWLHTQCVNVVNVLYQLISFSVGGQYKWWSCEKSVNWNSICFKQTVSFVCFQFNFFCYWKYFSLVSFHL